MEIKIFKHEKFGDIRTINKDGEPWFVGKDVARRLGYINPEKALRVHVDDEDKGVNEMGTPGGTQKVTFINESGLYSLILSSKLPQAKAFKRWVAKECFPLFAFLSVLFSCFWRFVCRCRDFCVTLHNYREFLVNV